MEKEPYLEDVRLAQQGNKDAFVRLIKKIEPTLYRVSRSILKSDQECIDATQEAILVAYSSIHTLKKGEYFKTWVVRILIHECYRMMKTKKVVVLIGEWIEQTTVSFDSTRQQILDLKDAIQALDPDLRVAVTLYYLEDLSVKTISQLVDVPEGTIKSRLSRARQKLSDMLGPVHNERGVGYE